MVGGEMTKAIDDMKLSALPLPDGALDGIAHELVCKIITARDRDVNRFVKLVLQNHPDKNLDELHLLSQKPNIRQQGDFLYYREDASVWQKED